MSNFKIYAYPMDKSFNLPRLTNEIKSNSFPLLIGSALAFSGEIQVKFDVALSATEETLLDTIISDHNGQIESRTSKVYRDKREEILCTLADMAHNHPVLRNNPNEISNYLRCVDAWFNQWKRDGNHEPLIAKIQTDAEDTTHDHFAFLNTTVNTSGTKTYQFLQSHIPTTPYI